ncbi:hypothetical protein [Salinibacterium sp. SWN248]|uniref:hypothetical protein n=1 Tax=Salinibacterium sp. SWN248 TaxID=2792056 RepID=UPI0018CF5C26|nr:hypothetical protein [Salinibacterium sp. SWN248]MBH0022837.1 hypothetical protein [Salinibacterium sp. SWN248]
MLEARRMPLVPGTSARRLHRSAVQFITVCVALSAVGLTLIVIGTQGIPVAYPVGVTLAIASGLALGWMQVYGYNRVEA